MTATRRSTTTVLALIAALAIVSPAYAETYTYACQVKDEATGNVHLYSAKLDTGNRTITWRGSVYRNMKEIPGNTDECGKACFTATRNDGATATLYTATQGVATLTAPGNNVECDLVRQ